MQALRDRLQDLPGQRNSRISWWSQDQHLLEVTVEILQNHLVPNLYQRKHQRGNSICLRIFPKTRTVRYASVRKLQEPLADEIHNVTCSARQSSVISLLPTTKSSMKMENCGATTGVQLLCKIWPLNGFRAIHAKTSQKMARSAGKFLDLEKIPKVTHTDTSLEFGKVCEDLRWNHLCVNSSSAGDKRSCEKSHTRHFIFTAVQTR